MSRPLIFFYTTITLWCHIYADIPGYTAQSGITPHLTYMFAHANTLHLITNLIAINAIFTPLSKKIHPLKLIPVMYIAAIIASYAAAYQTPTKGASAILCFLLGTDLILRWAGTYFKIDTTKMILYTLTIATYLIITAYTRKTNTPLHITALILGTLYGTYELLRNHKRKQTANR